MEIPCAHQITAMLHQNKPFLVHDFNEQWHLEHIFMRMTTAISNTSIFQTHNEQGADHLSRLSRVQQDLFIAGHKWLFVEVSSANMPPVFHKRSRPTAGTD